MDKNEIILLDDDIEDCELIKSAFEKLKIKRPVIVFYNADSAFDYLKRTKNQPFLIICSINMPGINGLEFKELINKHNDERIVATPFIFLTTSADPTTIRFAHSLNIQGYFEKPSHILKLEILIGSIVKYWERSNTRYPNVELLDTKAIV